MNRKETTISLAIVGMALLATIMTAMTPTQALAIDYGSPDSSYQPNGGFVRDGADSSGTSDNTDEESGDEDQEERTNAATANEDEGDKENSSGSGYGNKCKTASIPAMVDKMAVKMALVKAQMKTTNIELM